MRHKDIIVIKYGGSLMDNKSAEKKILRYVKKTALNNSVVVVHGGGKEITEELKKSKIETRFVNGLRYTDGKSIKIVEKVLEKIQNQLAKKLKNAKALKKVATGNRVKKLGYVGKFVSAKLSEIEKVLGEGTIAVVSPVGKNKNSQILNFNADEVASGIAAQLKAKKLVFFTDVAGVLDNSEKTIPTIRIESIKNLINKKIIRGGMIPKIQGCIKAIQNGVSEANIIDINFNGTRIL
ncbi:MAG: acetylglutamate kinase [Elusimicrobiota bacterium]